MRRMHAFVGHTDPKRHIEVPVGPIHPNILERVKPILMAKQNVVGEGEICTSQEIYYTINY
jgi:hypothetical protein